MWRRLHLNKMSYGFSHIPVYAKRLFDIKGNLKARYFGYLSNVILMVALCLGLYTRWVVSKDLAILFIAFLGLFVFAISCALVYYFSLETIGFSLSRLWIGCLIGVIAFTQDAKISMEATEEVMNFLLITSLIVRCSWNVLDRFLKTAPQGPKLLNKFEMIEILGMMIATTVTQNEAIPIILLLVALSLTIISMQLKSFFALLQLVSFIIVTAFVVFPKLLNMPVNVCALFCFLGRMAFEAIIDLYFSSLTTFERWYPLMSRRPVIRKLAVILVWVVELTFMLVCTLQIPGHKEWFIVVPLFAGAGFVWLCFHLVFVITSWQLMNKITDCNLTYLGLSDENRNMNTILASRGVRHFSLISQRLCCITMATTVLVTLIAWITHTALSMSLALLVFPIEIAVNSLLWEFGTTLGGTVAGYALVAPAIPHRDSSSGVHLVPTSIMQELSSRATDILNTVQRFFAFHLIENFGCDYSSSGLTGESVESKLKLFFQRVTVDGPRYDTYLVYYSGHVYDSGDWALAGGSTLKLESLLEWWQESIHTSGSESRLILILDTEHSHAWVRRIRRLRDTFVAVQTFFRIQNPDPEHGLRVGVGEFTSDWVSYNCNGEISLLWHNKERTVRALYAVSKCWTDFTFHLPTSDDIESHWSSSFPTVTKMLIRALNFPNMSSLFCCCVCIIRCLKRKRMSWLPPKELDTGHGFKLVSS